MNHPRDQLEAHEVDPKKSLGQNFLFDENILKRITDVGNVIEDDAVLEVGPGLGSLTQAIARKAGRVTAVEIDDRLIPMLRFNLGRFPNVEVHHADILEYDPAEGFGDVPFEHYKVIANVPYYITGAILEHLLSHPVKPSRVVLTVQKDVAERIVAKPPQMTILSNSVQFYGKPKMMFNLSAGSFWPRPKVASSVLLIDLTERVPETENVTDESRFFKILKAAFSQKRKQIHNNLQTLGLKKEVVQAWLASAGVDPKRRAETLEMAEWVALCEGYPRE